MARVLLHNVTKVFGDDIVAVSDIDLEVADGEFMVIVGPSGCGKTTSLRMIAGLEKATAGKIYIGDEMVNLMAPKDRDVAMVFQSFALYPHMTAYQNMAFALRMRKLPKEETKSRVEETAKLLGIEKLLDRKPRALSGGQRQRVALGRAIVRNPKAFLFDEPLSNLDARLRLAMRTELKNLHQRLQCTTVYVTHDQAEAMSLGDRISVMREGAIQQIAAPGEVYERPVNRFVAGFFGMPPMNFLAGRVECEGDRVCFVIDGETLVLPRDRRAVLQKHHGKEMVLGIRPEDVSPVESSGQVDNTISATVEVVEPLGARTDVFVVNRAGQQFVAGIDPHTRLEAKDKIRAHIDVAKTHVFEADGAGRNVTLSGQVD